MGPAKLCAEKTKDLCRKANNKLEQYNAGQKLNKSRKISQEQKTLLSVLP